MNAILKRVKEGEVKRKARRSAGTTAPRRHRQVTDSSHLYRYAERRGVLELDEAYTYRTLMPLGLVDAGEWVWENLKGEAK